jgi:multiple sugar transport system ATP-binding protein
MSDTVSREDRSREERVSEEADGDANRASDLRVDRLTKVFTEDSGEEVVAVDDVTIDIRKGEFLVLVGPSGCGKTTTLRAIAGLEAPTEGRIVIEDRDVSGLEPRERDVAMVFQNYALYPHKTVRENLSFPLEIRKFPGETIAERVEETAEMLGIAELLDRRPSDLSGGQQQRVALGRAIVRDPVVFLFDEPLSNLDAKLRIQMRTELNKLHERVGKTSVYVTHDQAEAMTLGDRVAIMREGDLQQIDPPQTVYEQPVNRFVAGFIGEPPMNFFDVAIEERGEDLLVVSPAFELQLPDGMAARLREHESDWDDLSFGARPEDLYDASVTADSTLGEADTFEATVAVVEPMGAHKDLTLTPVSENADFEFTARVDADSTAREGDVLTLAVDLPKTHLFAGRSGENLTL